MVGIARLARFQPSVFCVGLSTPNSLSAPSQWATSSLWKTPGDAGSSECHGSRCPAVMSEHGRESASLMLTDARETVVLARRANH